MRPTIASGTSFTKANHTRTLLILGAALLALAALAWVILSLISGEVRRQIAATLESTKATASTAATRFLERQRATTLLLAKRGTVVRSTDNLIKGDAAMPAVLAEHFTATLPSQDFDGWAIAMPDGRILASGQASAGWTAMPQPLLARLPELLTGKPVLLPPVWVQHGTDQRAAFVTAAPLVDGERTIAVLVLTMDPVTEFSAVLETARFGETGETYACTGDGLLASRSRYFNDLVASGLIPKDAPNAILRLMLRRPPMRVTGDLPITGNPAEWPFTTAAAGIIAKSPGISLDNGFDYRGMPVVAAWTMLGDTGMGLVTKIDRSEAFRPLIILRIIFLSVFGLLAIVTISGVFWFANVVRLRHKLDKAKGQLQSLGQYTLEKKIGEGGMGAVYLGRHALMRRPTAIKLITGGVNADALARFEREVQMSCRLSHPNTIAIYDYGRTADGTFYYAMELLDGMDLEAMVTRHGTLPPARVIHFLAQACGSLAEAHDLKMLHRDIKPANLFVTKRGGERDVLKILDFGLVKSMESDAPQLSRADVISGTPPYMAPEVIGQKPGVDGRSDMYALGCVGYFLLSGICPFERGTSMDTLMAHLKDAPKPLPEVAKQPIPADLERAIMHTLMKDPAQRPASLRAFRDELLACADARTWCDADADAWWLMIDGQSPVASEHGHAPTTKTDPLPNLVVRTGDIVVSDLNQKASPKFP